MELIDDDHAGKMYADTWKIGNVTGIFPHFPDEIFPDSYEHNGFTGNIRRHCTAMEW